MILRSPTLPQLVRVLLLVVSSLFTLQAATPKGESSAAAQWRRDRILIDHHMHISPEPAHIRRAVGIMDAAGIGVGMNLSGGSTVPGKDGVSPFERTRRRFEEQAPGRFLHYFNLDYSGWDDPEFPARAVEQVEAAHRLGAAGLKEFKRLGLFLRDARGQLIGIDDRRLDSVWHRCGELGLPVSIHVADPRAFWSPYTPSNERWTELKDHPNWWFGDPAKYPPREELLAALLRVIQRHPKTTFVCVHFLNNAEDLGWVDRILQDHPNVLADLAARIPEIGRHEPAQVRKLFLKHQDRILFATDFQVYDRLTLGSGGSGPPPDDTAAALFFQKHWHWLESDLRQFPHMTPIQGDWKIDAIDLPDRVLRKIYFENALRLHRDRLAAGYRSRLGRSAGGPP